MSKKLFSISLLYLPCETKLIIAVQFCITFFGDLFHIRAAFTFCRVAAAKLRKSVRCAFCGFGICRQEVDSTLLKSRCRAENRIKSNQIESRHDSILDEIIFRIFKNMPKVLTFCKIQDIIKSNQIESNRLMR